MLTVADEPKVETENEIQEYIFNSIPGISHDDMWEIRCQYIHQFIPLSVCVYQYKLKVQLMAWNKSKDKRYYKVKMYNHGTKVVYMCPEAVNNFYQGRIIKEYGR